jgi:hypothetical protein
MMKKLFIGCGVVLGLFMLLMGGLIAFKWDDIQAGIEEATDSFAEAGAMANGVVTEFQTGVNISFGFTNSVSHLTATLTNPQLPDGVDRDMFARCVAAYLSQNYGLSEKYDLVKVELSNVSEAGIVSFTHSKEYEYTPAELASYDWKQCVVRDATEASSVEASAAEETGN